MERFHPTTSAEEARNLTALCLQAIAAGWSILYMTPGKVRDLQGNRIPEPNLDLMTRDAADLAARITMAAGERLPSACIASPDGRHDLPGGYGDTCSHCQKEIQ